MQNKNKTVPAWYIVNTRGEDLDGPYFLQSVAHARAKAFPGSKVKRREVPFVESSILARHRTVRDF